MVITIHLLVNLFNLHLFTLDILMVLLDFYQPISYLLILHLLLLLILLFLFSSSFLSLFTFFFPLFLHKYIYCHLLIAARIIVPSKEKLSQNRKRMVVLRCCDLLQMSPYFCLQYRLHATFHYGEEG